MFRIWLFNNEFRDYRGFICWAVSYTSSSDENNSCFSICCSYKFYVGRLVLVISDFFFFLLHPKNYYNLSQ